MNEQQLDQAINKLTSQVTPERDLWLDIEPRLSAHANRAKSPSWYLAAAAMFGLMSMLGWQLTQLPDSKTPTVAAQPTAELLLLQLYEQQKATHLSQMVAVNEGFDNWQQQLQVWDQAIAQVRHALQFYPDEPQLLAKLQSLYQQQLSYIQRATLHNNSVIS